MNTPEDTSPVPEFPTQADLEAFVSSLGLPPDAAISQVYSALKSEVAAGNIPPGYRPKEDTSTVETPTAPAEADPPKVVTSAPGAEVTGSATSSATGPEIPTTTPSEVASTEAPFPASRAVGTVVGTFTDRGVTYNIIVAEEF